MVVLNQLRLSPLFPSCLSPFLVNPVFTHCFSSPASPTQDPHMQAFFPRAEPAALALLKRLLAFDPSDRPTADEALADPYFAGTQKGGCVIVGYNLLSLPCHPSWKGCNRVL